MMKELITIIITTYNRSDKIENAIKSAINQTYNNFEIIVVDDNSNNIDERKKTQKIVEKYATIKLIQNDDNLGGALSRNVGIEKANGNLISFLDDDDVYLPNRLEEMYQTYLEHKDEKIGLVYCSCDRIDDNKNILGSYINNYDGLPLYRQMLGCIAGTSMWLAPKNVLKEVGLFENSPCKQDSILLLKIIANGYNVYSVNKCLVLYYEHGGNGISGTKKSNIDGLINYRNWCRKYYYLLKDNNQIKNVEYNFSRQLVSLYVINNMMSEAKNELKYLIKTKPFSINTLKGFYKIYFRDHYIKKIFSN